LSLATILNLLILTPAAFAQIQAYNFDFDDNIFVTPARIVVWDNANQAELEISTGYWALLKNKIGKEDPYKNFSKRPDFLRNFGDVGPEGTGLFAKQILQALQSSTESWKAPSWPAFQEAMSNEETRSHATIITARLHAPQSILAGLLELKRLGYIAAVPDLDHIYVVGWPGFDGRFKGATDPESKANVMTFLLDDLERQPIPKTATEKQHVWSFSDDDYDNFSKALNVLSPKVAAGRWPHVKIVLVYTGINNPSQPRHALVIKPDGSTRPAQPGELAQLHYQ
jgi:hypothetical protein